METPKKICIMRLSALGDISHMMPIIHTLQSVWPNCKITWIIGKVEHQLVNDLPNINFIVFDKSKKWRAYQDIKKALKNKQFDLLLHMQLSLRSSIATLFVRALIKQGFDKKRAHDFQWLFTNKKIAYCPKQHVIESFFCFLEAVGIKQRILNWTIPIPQKSHDWAKSVLPCNHKKTLIIAPCSSHSYRNWTISGYQDVAKYALRKNMNIVLVGDNREIEHQYANQIQAVCDNKCINLTGKTTLKHLLAILTLGDVILAPDSGPAHLATACNTPVIGLYACTNPDRARPYKSKNTIVNHYPEAVLAKYGKPVENLPWGIRVRDKGTMDKITSEEVKLQLDKFI